jgi:hypothetical protein
MIFGYLDPVTGSALVQVGLAALAAIGLGWQYVRKAGISFISAIRGGEHQDRNEATATEIAEAETSNS